MTWDQAPACERHEGGGVQMELQSIHSDATQPDLVVGLFECPECGHERRLPLGVGEIA